MMQNLPNMSWGDIKAIKHYTENNSINKTKNASKTSSIILAGIQLFENYIKGLKTLNAYDAASTISSHSNWIQNSSHELFKDSSGKKITIEVGKIYYIDFGNMFYGELSYFHYGLCIGKRENKILIIPMTSGTKYISTCYHPVNNPHASRKYRQALLSEGFQKDCVLKIDDMKFISSGRIIREEIKIPDDVLKDIQHQAFSVAFPNICQKHDSYENKIPKLEEKIKYQKESIDKLKAENNRLKQLLKNQESK